MENQQYTTRGFLDVIAAKGFDHDHSGFWGDCICLRDDDGMGFSLNIPAELKGKLVKITIDLAEEQPEKFWGKNG